MIGRGRVSWIVAVLGVAGLAGAYVVSGQAAPKVLALPSPWAALAGVAPGAEVRVARPAAVWALPLALLPYLLAGLARSLADHGRVQAALQLLLRLLLLAALGLATAEPTHQVPSRGRAVAAVFDRSASMGAERTAVARELAADLQAAVARANEEAGAPEDGVVLRRVHYAARPRPVTAPGGEDPWRSPLPDAASGSDHGAALRLARALLETDRDPRVVFVTDGMGAPAEIEGALSALSALRAEGVPVYVRVPRGPQGADVAVLAVDMPLAPKAGETVHAVARVWAQVPVRARLWVRRNGAPNPLAPEVDADLHAGPTDVRIPVRVTEPGPGTVTVEVDPGSLPPDLARIRENDRAATVYFVQRRPNVLYVGRDPSRALPRALRADGIEVTEVGLGGLPDTVEALAVYDAVVLSDVPASALGSVRGRNLARYVTDVGGGLVMVGGEHTYGPGGFGGTALDEVLPVRFEGSRQREQPTLALVLVIDKSGSMSSQDKLELVKAAARSTARTLDPSDEIAVIAFDSQPHVLVRLQPAAHRIRITGDIRRLAAGGGTNAVPALREAYLQLAGSRALVKHVILLSDGESPERGMASVLADMRDADITVSTVGVGAGAGKDFLARVARRGGGRFYYSHDATDVPRIFSREAREATRNAVEERRFHPWVRKAAQVLRGIDFDSAPPLLGLVPLRPKARAEVLLAVREGGPLLVRGRFGLGRTYAFASDAMPRWAARWIAWSGFAKFWSQVVRDAMRRRDDLAAGATLTLAPAGPGRIRATVDVEGTVDGFADGLTGEVALLPLPGGDATAARSSASLSLTAPGRYEADFAADTTTLLLARARLFDPEEGGGRPVHEAVARHVPPRAPEFDPRAARRDTLERLRAHSADGRLEGSVRAAVDAPPTRQLPLRRTPLWPRVVVFLVAPLFLVDLALRRIQLGR